MTPIRTRPIGRPEDPLGHRPDLVWISPDIELFGWGRAHRLAAGFGPERFGRAEAAFDQWVANAQVDDPVRLPGTGPVAFASFTFDERSAGSVLVIPELIVGRSGEVWFTTTTGSAEAALVLDAPVSRVGAPTDRPRFAGTSIPDMLWLESVAEAIDRIAEGAISKVVLARDFALWSKSPFDHMRLVSRLRDRFPECFTFLVDGLVGASPELLLEMRDRTVESQSLAGSARRSPDAVEDERIGRELLASDKDRREHESAAESVGRALGEVCDRLERDAQPTLLKLANVQHLATRFAGTLARRHPILELIERLHPTAAVGGTPTERAVELIRELEQMDRGRYAGPVGWFDAASNGAFAIALRCAELSGARARLFAGAGIVEGSLPENELEETRIKLLAMQSAFE
ncbi:MAG TPA: isochorismate synthase [Acidimicrobiia bacterium]